MGSDHLPTGRGPGPGSGPWAAGPSTWPTGSEGGRQCEPRPSGLLLSPAVSVWPPHLAPTFPAEVMLPPKGPKLLLGVKNLRCDSGL